MSGIDDETLMAFVDSEMGEARATDVAAQEVAKPAAFKLPNWTALAATLLVGVIAGKFIDIGPQPLIGARGGALTAGGKLETALNDQLASDPATGTVRIGLSFREGDGTYCRTFRVVKGDAVAGIACRQSGGWGVRMAVAAGPLQGADYRMAASDTPPAVLAAVAGMIKGEALDGPVETAARDKGWK